MLHYMPYALVIALWIYAFVDCLGTPEQLVRGLPKMLWLVVILLFGPVMLGPLTWMAIGKRRGPVLRVGSTQWSRVHRPEPRPEALREAAGQPAEEPGADWIPPDDNPAFLRSLDELNRNRRKDGTAPEGEGLEG